MLDTCNMHLCYFYQKTPVALHLIFDIFFNCSPQQTDWNVHLGEANKLILCKFQVQFSFLEQ